MYQNSEQADAATPQCCEIIPPENLREIFENYQKVAGYQVDLVNKHAERKGA